MSDSSESTPSVTLREADGDGLAYVERLLEAEGLPTSDVRSKSDCFYVGHDGERRVGVGGVETYGPHGLLRSVVTDPSARGAGFGVAICRALEREARTAGVETLYLLTTTAAEFFVDRGYSETPRGSVPEPVRGTTQFADLCPASATCLRKSLPPRG